ncbi:MAG: amidohydrolase family protein, partial [Eubacterium sp.]|nr:amidohydrolase family protein [Eubacterium sp.]
MIRFYNGKVLSFKNGTEITNDEVWVDGAKIVYVGKSFNKKADREINLNGNLLMPSFKNAHTHSAMTFARSLADDLPLQPWLYELIFPMEAKLTGEDIYHLSKLAFLEYLTSGISACFDMYYFPEDMARASVDFGFRTVMTCGLNNFKESIEKLEEYYNTFNNYNELISYKLGFHAEYTTSKELLEGVSALAQKYKAPVFTHSSETESEVKECIERYGKTPTALFDELGLFNYGGCAYHSVWVDD